VISLYNHHLLVWLKLASFSLVTMSGFVGHDIFA
jgi:hypothetical protein